MLESVFGIFPMGLRSIMKGAAIEESLLEEIRFRVNSPLIFQYAGKEWYLRADGKLTDEFAEACLVKESDIREMMTYLSRFSIYAFEEDVRNGFITLPGGHRVGVAGHVVMEDGKISGMQYINFLNIRIAREKKGCAEKLLPYLLWRNSIFNSLIVSPPGIGKTTYLRDCIRLLSDGTVFFPGKKICVIDERSEIAACDRGIPQNDLGIRTDVIDACKKAQGMLMALRSLSPQIIAVDELGGEEDFLAVEQIIHCGSRILGTIHAGDMRELYEKLRLCGWDGKKIFERFILLEKKPAGTRSFQVFDENMEKIC